MLPTDSLPPFNFDPLQWRESATEVSRPRVRRPRELGARVAPVVGSHRITLAMFPDKEHARNVVVPLIDELVFGRSVECDFTWTWDRAISRQHCRFYRVGNQVWLEDLGSSRGTWVNGDSIERCLLEGGEVITVGKTPFQAFILRVD